MPASAPDLRYQCEEVVDILKPEPELFEAHMEEVEGSVEMMLARLDELATMLEALNIQTVEQRIELEPLLTAFASKLEQDYARIDKTAEGVAVMRQAVNHMETELANAEALHKSKMHADSIAAMSTALKSVVGSFSFSWPRSTASETVDDQPEEECPSDASHVAEEPAMPSPAQVAPKPAAPTIGQVSMGEDDEDDDEDDDKDVAPPPQEKPQARKPQVQKPPAISANSTAVQGKPEKEQNKPDDSKEDDSMFGWVTGQVGNLF
mmetsp:Transcript_38023/g.71312  ORF Transcript_38023/g.71312 Transcript_38023/m.71312 type:complete len:264 (+) Transcript_38023:173-964(+)